MSLNCTIGILRVSTVVVSVASIRSERNESIQRFLG
jgi:hypothetical protein